MSKPTNRLNVQTSGLIALCLVTASMAGCSRDPNVQKVKYLESGKRYEKSGKYKEAAIQFANALKADKNYGDAHYELAKSYIQMGMMQAGYNELVKTVELSPNNIQARMDTGNLALAGGQPDAAAVQANAVLAAQPNNADAYAMLANVAIRKGDSATALTQIGKALAIDPNRAAFHATLGMLQTLNPATLAQSQDELTKAVQLDPANAAAHLGLAAIMEKKGDIAGAVQQLNAAVAADPKNLPARTSLAALYIRSKDQPKAEAVLRKATEDLSETTQGADLLRSYYAQQNQMDKAETAYADLASKHPESTQLKLVYAHILVARGKVAQATEVSKELTKSKPKDPQVVVLNAMLLLNAGKVDEANTALQEALKDSPDNASVRLWAGMTARARGDIPTAQQNFQQVLQVEPGNFGAQKGLAEIASSKGDFTLLRQIAASAIARFGNLPDGYLWRGTAAANEHDLDKAAADFQMALTKDPNNSAGLLELAQVRIAQHRVDEGRKLLEQSVASSGNAQALHLLTALDMQAKQTDKATARIQQLISRFPQSGALYDELGAVQLSQRNGAGALASAQKAMDLNPSDSLAVKTYTQAQILTGNVGPAITKWEQWVASHPKDPQGYAVLGLLEESAGDATKAMEYYKKTLELQPQQPAASNNLAYLMAEHGQNLDVALTLAQTARRGLPNSASTDDTLGWVYFRKGQYDSARNYLEDAAKLDPNNAAIHYHLGMTYSRLNRKPDAQVHLNKAITLAPNTQTMKDATQELQRLG